MTKIHEECIFYPPSDEDYQTTFIEESKGVSKATHLQVQAILGKRQKSTWWIQKNLFHDRETYTGVVCLDGIYSKHALPTDQDVFTFYNKFFSIPNLEVLRKKQVEKINILQSNYRNHIFSCSSSIYCQTVYNEEYEGSLEKALQIDVLEAKTTLGKVRGKTWWIREGFYNNQKISKGVVYTKGTCYHRPLLTDDDWIAFFDKNSSILDLKTLQKEKREKINMIQNNHMFFCSSSTYCQTVFNEECEGSFEKACHMDVLEAQTILGKFKGKTWWIREGFSDNQKIYKGIIYLNGACSYHSLLTDNNWIAFFNKNSSTLDLKTLQKERRKTINMIQIHHMFSCS